jgi:hypothetical protein
MEGVRPEVLLGLHLADDVYRRRGFELVVTSLLDGKHSEGSLHYLGLAADLRTRDIPAVERHSMREALEQALGEEWDVVLEADHMHIEFDPGPKTAKA